MIVFEDATFATIVKHFVAIILFVLLGLQSFYPLAIYTYYYGNKTYVASVLCENKDNPQLQCNGTCFLKKQLKKAEEKQGQDKMSFKEIEPLVYIINKILLVHQHIRSLHARTYPVIDTNSYSFLFIASFFRPPGI